MMYEHISVHQTTGQFLCFENDPVHHESLNLSESSIPTITFTGPEEEEGGVPHRR